MRTALGATRLRLIGQRLTETFLLAGIGCVVSAAIAWGGVRFLMYVYGGSLPRTNEIALNSRLLWFALLFTVAAALLLGLTTAMREERDQLEPTLREGAGAFGSRRSTRMRKVLVAVQAACALTLVSGSFELLESFQNLMRVNPGFDTPRLVTLHIVTQNPKMRPRES